MRDLLRLPDDGETLAVLPSDARRIESWARDWCDRLFAVGVTDPSTAWSIALRSARNTGSLTSADADRWAVERLIGAEARDPRYRRFATAFRQRLGRLRALCERLGREVVVELYLSGAR